MKGFLFRHREFVLAMSMVFVWMVFLMVLALLFCRAVDISLAASSETTREAKLLAAEVGAWER